MKRKYLKFAAKARRVFALSAVCAILSTATVAQARTTGQAASEIDYSTITYSWTDSQGRQHVSSLDERAESYEQIVALVKEVYTNPRVPGFIKDPIGYGTDFTEGTNVHQYVRYEPCTQAPWNMPADLRVETPVEGATALLIELHEDYNHHADHSAEDCLRHIKAASVLTKRMHIGEESQAANPGYLFNYVGTLNKFFIVTKGSNRVPNNAPGGFGPFFNMFEEFSPSNAGPISGAYFDMNSGEQFAVDHNCSTVMGQNHIVIMGDPANSVDYPVNFLFYLPDYRFAGDTRTKDGVHHYEWYTYYSPDHMPFVFFSKINARIPTAPAADLYTGKASVNVVWKSTYKSVSRSKVPEEFYIYRVENDIVSDTPVPMSDIVLNPEAFDGDMWFDGETGMIVGTGSECSVFVAEDMRSISHNVRYIVTGRRHGSDFEMTESNIVKTVIPTLTQTGELEIRIDGEGESVYDGDNERNKYTNRIMLLDHSSLGDRVLQRRHVRVNADGPATRFTLKRVVTEDVEEATAVEVATLEVVSEHVETMGETEYYVYDATISYPAGTVTDELPVTARFRSARLGVDEDDDLIQISAMEENDDVLAVFTDRFEASTRNGDQPEIYRYYVEYEGQNGIARARAAGRAVSRTLSNMVEVNVPVRELKAGFIPYTASDIAADTDASDLLTPNVSAIWIETRTDPRVAEYIVRDVTNDINAAKVTRLPSGQLEIKRASANGTLQKYDVIESGSKEKPVIELGYALEGNEEFSLQLVYTNGNTYGNRRVNVSPLPAADIVWDALVKDLENSTSTSPVYKAYIGWEPTNLGEGDDLFEVYGYRVWAETNGDGSDTLVYGLDGDTLPDNIELASDGSQRMLGHSFGSHEASVESPVSVAHTIRLYSVIPEDMRVFSGAADPDALYAVADLQHSRTIYSSDGVVTAVEGIETAPEGGDPEYYDLTGRRVNADELGGGVYIRTLNGKSEKIVIR